MNEDFKIVERVYIIPLDEIKERNIISISIYKNPIRHIPWYEKFRVSEKQCKDTYRSMKIDNCHVLGKKGL